MSGANAQDGRAGLDGDSEFANNLFFVWAAASGGSIVYGKVDSLGSQFFTGYNDNVHLTLSQNTMQAVTKKFVIIALLFVPLVAQGQIDPIGETPEDQAAAITALKGISSNLQKNRDGTVRFVRFSKAVVEDKHLDQIRVFKQLDYLSVITGRVTDVGLANIAQLTNLDSLILTNTQATDTTVALIGKLAKLEVLYLDNTQVTDAGLDHLSTLNELKILSLSKTQITGVGLKSLTGLVKLETLHLKECNLSDEIFETLAEIKSLKSIYLDGTKVTGKGLVQFESLEGLEQLSFNQTPFAPASLEEIQVIVSLKHVLLWGTDITTATLPQNLSAELRQKLRLTPEKSERLSPFQKFIGGQSLDKIEQAKRDSGIFDGIKIDESVAHRFSKATDETPDFQRHVVPMLGKLGCNGRACHGSFQGQGGFSLSLFGYDFATDHLSMLDEDAGRVVPESPDDSLLIMKPTLGIDHEGGRRIAEDSWQLRLLQRWISSGAKRNSEVHELLACQVTPQEIFFSRGKLEQQLQVTAIWSNGLVEDVTALARIETLDDQIAIVDENGRVTNKAKGDTHLVVSYDRAVVAVPVLRPVSDKTGDNYPDIPWRTRVDELVGEKLKRLGIVASDVCTDQEFLRRSMLDVAGTLPSPTQITEFTNDASLTKRADLVERLLQSEAYIDWWAMKLADVTGANSQHLGSTDMNSPAALQWQRWLRARVAQNASWKEIVAGLVLADSREPGQTYDQYTWEHSSYQAAATKDDFNLPGNSMPYYWARSDLNTAENKVLNFSYVFMGVRLQCAQCHKHPFDQWSKQDFDQFSQVFSRIRWGTEPESQDARTQLMTRLGVPKKLDTAALRRQMYNRVSAEGLPIPWFELYIEPPRTSEHTAVLLGGKPFDLNQFDDPREVLFSWLIDDDNPFFAPAFVNRVWNHYFGVGLVNPVDDLNAGNPPSNAKLMKYLSAGFSGHDFDMKWLHREILLSDTYQRSWRTNETNQHDERHFSYSRLRRLPAEVLVDAIEQSTAKSSRNETYLNDTTQRKITSHPRSLSPNSIDYALAIFGKPTRATNCDCERTAQPTLLQNLYIRNDRELLELIERKTGWLAEVAQQTGIGLHSETSAAILVKANTQVADSSTITADELVTAAYARMLSRRPTAAEMENGRQYIADSDDLVEGLRGLVWALLNTQEFLTNH